MQTVDDNLYKINKTAESARLGQTLPLDGPTVGYDGYKNGMYVSGNAPSTIVIKFDGEGGWFLYTAYPNVR